MRPDLSAILSLRDAETYLPKLTRELAALVDDGRPFEILALDQRSRDNTLAALSLLEQRVPQLTAFQDVPPGTAILRASRMAKGDTWLILDGPVDPAHARWALEAVRGGRPAAFVGPHLLAVERELAQGCLGWMRGDVARAQRHVRRALARRGQAPLVHPGPAPGFGLSGMRARLSPRAMRRRALGLLTRVRIRVERRALGPEL